MPLEIKELQIRITVNQPGSQPGSLPASSVAADNKDEKESIINHCIEQVLEMINNKKER